MNVIHTASDLRECIGRVRPAFVPTMGALHEGHLALIRRACALKKPVVVSIFVNPTQFGAGEDFSLYPRTPEADLAAVAATGADFVFMPDRETVYPPNQYIPIPSLPDVATLPQLEDAHRPTHFAGVCQVVARLFDLVQPSVAVFGEKDYQQLLVITSMVSSNQERWSALRIESCQTVREPDGIAMSSRNAYLTSDQRTRALGISRALKASMDHSCPMESETIMRDILNDHKLEIDYAVVREAATLMPLSSYDRHARALIAARVDDIRLIDNMPVGD